MSLNFAAISPHPPIIIPEIGTNEDLQKVANTVLAMKKIASKFKEAEIDTLIIISPHMLIYPDQFSICGMKKTFGTFTEFSHPDIMTEFQNDLDLAIEIDKAAQVQGLKTLLYDNGGEFMELDHGLMVPLKYLTMQQEFSFKIVPIAYSNLDRASHFSFGQVIGEATKNYQGRIGIIASGDLSHRLIQGAPAGFSKTGQEFDKKFVDDLKNNKTQNILYYDEEFVEEAGECGYRSILILLGALDGLDATPEILSYEGPFGVGYLVANYKLPEA